MPRTIRPPAVWDELAEVWVTDLDQPFGPSAVCWGTWPAAGMTRSGSLFPPPTSAPLTSGAGSSSSLTGAVLPTPSASCATGPGTHGDGGVNLQTAVSRL